MNTDHAFIIGDTHRICQDYALSGTVENGAYAIISDGCSDAEDSDVGARLIAMAARETLFLAPGMSYKEFGDATLSSVWKSKLPFFMLNTAALNATLLVAWVKENRVKAYIYGDGVLCHRRPDVEKKFHIEFKNDEGKSYPPYLAYWLQSQEKRDEYLKVAGKKKITESSIYRGGSGCIGGGQSIKEVAPLEPFIYEAGVVPGDVISLSSDGINSFRQANGDSILWHQMADEMFGFKLKTGQFVNRRLLALQRQCEKDQTTHYDDISVASIVV
jgi:hypothetical protein